MKTRLRYCDVCKEETLQDIGKKQATSQRGAYLKRGTVRCRKCGTKEINNSHSGKRIITGKNEKTKEQNKKKTKKA